MHSLNQTQVLLFFAASAKERAKGTGIVTTTLLESQGNRATHDNGDMADDAVKIPQLGFSLKVEVMFHYLEKYLDIPQFSVDTDSFFVGKVYLGREDGQPLAFVAVADKDDFNLLLLFGFHRHVGQNSGLTPPLLQLGEEPTQSQPLPLMPGKDFRHVLVHADHRQMFAQGGKQGREGKPAVHQEVVGPDAQRQHPSMDSRCSVDLAMASSLRL